MATEKLHELIEILKKQGIQQGEDTASQIIDAANAQANEILQKAQNEAKSIVNNANSEADKTLKRLQSSMEIAASQFIGNLKRVIETQLLAIPLKKKLSDDLSNPEFLKDLIKIFVTTYAADTRQSQIRLLIPEGADETLRNFAIELIGQHYSGKGDAVSMVMESHNMKFGFQVDRADGNVRLDFTEEAFLSLFKEFLTPKFRELFSDIKLGAS